MAERPLEGLHVVLIPTWYPTPERPTGGRIFNEYIEAFTGAGARVGVLYPDLVDLGNLPGRMSEPGYWGRVREMDFLLPWPWPLITDEAMAGAPVVRVRGIHTSLGKKVRRIDRYAAWLKRAFDHYVARHGIPDVLNPHCAVPAGWAALRLADGLKPRPRVVLTEHTGPFDLLLREPAIAERTLAACHEADAVAAVGEFLRAEMQSAGVRRPIEIIPNAVSSPFRFAEKPPVGRAPNGKRLYRAIYAGRYSKAKGIPELVEAIERIAREPDLEVHWDFFGFADEGDKSEEERLLRVFSSGAAKGMGTIHGMRPREEIAPVLRDSHLMILPSHRDNCPLAVVEARSVGRPIVGTRGSGMENYVGPEDGLLCRINDPEDLTRTVLELLRSYDRWDARAIAARAEQEFSTPAIASKYARLFASAGEARPGRAAPARSS